MENQISKQHDFDNTGNCKDGDCNVTGDSLYEIIEENNTEKNEICDTSLYETIEPNIEKNGNGREENDKSEDATYDVIDVTVINVCQPISGGDDRIEKESNQSKSGSRKKCIVIGVTTSIIMIIVLALLSVLLQALLSLNYEDTSAETAIDAEDTHDALFRNKSISTEGPNLPRKQEDVNMSKSVSTSKKFHYAKILNYTYTYQPIHRSGDKSPIHDMLQMGSKIWFLSGTFGGVKINTYNTNGEKDEEKRLALEYNMHKGFFTIHSVKASPDGSIIALGGYEQKQVYGVKDNSEHFTILRGDFNGFTVYNKQLFAFDCRRSQIKKLHFTKERTWEKMNTITNLHFNKDDKKQKYSHKLTLSIKIEVNKNYIYLLLYRSLYMFSHTGKLVKKVTNGMKGGALCGVDDTGNVLVADGKKLKVLDTYTWKWNILNLPSDKPANQPTLAIVNTNTGDLWIGHGKFASKLYYYKKK